MAPESTFAGGILLGLVSSLHCAAMCGPIAAAVLFATERADAAPERLTPLVAAQAGKAVSYCAAAAAFAAGPDVASRHNLAFAFAYGLAWGAVPCGFVYAALMTAALTGSVVGAVSVMLGFALGTAPAVIISALGLSSLRFRVASDTGKRVGGALIAAFGIAGLLLTGPAGFNCL